MRMELDLEVPEDMAAIVRTSADRALSAVQPAMVEQAEIVRTLSMEIVPVDQGILKNSALEVGTQIESQMGSLEVSIGYGGAASSYALIQHETPPDVFSHAPGQSWKYLERPMLESGRQIGEAITEAIVREFSGPGGSGETFGEGE